jgi:hypothetical protein
MRGRQMGLVFGPRSPHATPTSCRNRTASSAPPGAPLVPALADSPGATAISSA